ncbi:zinc finger protein [Theobroma cacao]|nr:zinc finger protein [Theobroma cacao]
MNPLSILLNKCTLNGDNYSEWKRNLNIVLNYDKITWVLFDHEPEALTPQSTPQDIEYHKKWHDANELVKCYILAFMNIILQKQHEGMGNATDIMLHLHEMFGTKTRFAKVKAINAFKDLKQKLGESIRDYMLKVISCLNEVELNGVEINAETQISMIVRRLNSSFSQFKLDYELHTWDYTLSGLMNDLQNVEEVLDLKKKLEAHAISTSKPKPKGKKKITRNKKISKSLVGAKKKPMKKKTTSKDNTKGKCFHCGAKGHLKRNCKVYLEEIQKNK